MITKRKTSWLSVFGILILQTLPCYVLAQRDVHWQINPRGFPGDVSVFVDVEENGVFKRDLKSDAFAVSMDEYAGDQGGWILNQSQVVAGQAGAQVLIMIDLSSSYTSEFDKAKQIMKGIVKYLDPARDTVAIATAPQASGYSEATLEQGFTNDQALLNQTIDRIKHFSSSDKSGARFCNALVEGLKWFPEKPSDRYRAIIFLTGGADKGEGDSHCVQESYTYGLVPIFPIVFKLDKRYDDPRNKHKIENKSFDLAQNTGGRSAFRRSENELMQFVGLFWNRIRSQYNLRVTFPCYQPTPITEHWSVLKVEGRDVDGIKFKATSAPAPTPTITAIYPEQASRKDIDDGKIDLTVDGNGFCGPPGVVQVYVGGNPTTPKSANPFRIVTTLNSLNDTGRVKVLNRFKEQGESPFDFKVVKPPKGAEASATLSALVVGLVILAVAAILLVGIRSRKAKPQSNVRSKPQPEPQRVAKAAPTPKSTAGGSAKTMAIGAIKRAWLERSNGDTVELKEGDNAIGREPSCQVVLEVAGVSREHARVSVELDQGLIWVEDLGSTNGTYFGGPDAAENDLVRLSKKQLISSGDTIWISGERLVLHTDSRAEG